MSEFDSPKYEDLPPNPVQIENFVRRVDRRIIGGLTSEYSDPDMAIALISHYAMTNRKQGEVIKGVEQLKTLLSSENFNDAAYKLNISKERLEDNVARFVRMIARELNSILNGSDTRFSQEMLETMRQKINNILGQEVLKAPMDEAAVYDLMDFYMTSEMEGNRKASLELTGNQINRALLRLEGNQWSEIAQQTGTKETTASKEYSNTIGKIALAMRNDSISQASEKLHAKKNRQKTTKIQDMAQVEEETVPQDKTVPSSKELIENTLLPNETQNPSLRILSEGKERSKESTQLNVVIDLFVHRKIISAEGGKLFKSHVGIIELSGYTANERILLTHTCEQLRLLIKGNVTLEDEIRGANISRITDRLLGNQTDARNPVPRNELVRRYLTVEKDGLRLFKTVVDCEKFVDRSVLGDLQKYLLNR